MKKFAMRASALAVLALCQPAFANEIDDLKAEIAAQKAAEAAQQARLDALEQRLDAMSSQPAAAPAKAPVAVDKALLTDQNGGQDRSRRRPASRCTTTATPACTSTA